MRRTGLTIDGLRRWREPGHRIRPAEFSDGWLFATLFAIAVVSSIIGSLGAPLVPSIAAEEQVSISTAQWTLTATMVSAAATTPIIGRWGTGRLRRPVLLGSLALVLVGLLLAALPAGIGGIIAGRTLQGLGLAVAPLTLAVAAEAWTGTRLMSRISLLSIASVAGSGLGYPFSALTARYAGVAAAYWAGAALLVMTLGLALRYLPRQAEGEPQDVDLIGAGLLGAGMIASLLAVSRGESWGWASGQGIALIALGFVFVSGWVLRSALVSGSGGQPLIDLKLVRRRGVVGPNAAGFFLAIGTYGLLALVVLLIQADGSRGWGLSLGVVTAGVALVPFSLMGVAGSRMSIRMTRRWNRRVILPTGSVLSASALVILAFCHDHLWQIFVAMAIGGLGSGLVFSSMPMLLFPHVPRLETGSVLSFNQLLRYAGFAAGSAAAVAMLEVYGGDRAAFQISALTFAAICLVSAAVGSVHRS